jgi:hypothetical protein
MFSGDDKIYQGEHEKWGAVEEKGRKRRDKGTKESKKVQ